MGRVVIVAYKPKAGMEEQLKDLLQTHVALLRQEGLASERKSVQMQAADGTIVEVFEWCSSAAIEQAHHNQIVQNMWQKFAEVCEFVPVSTVAETDQLFSEFSPLN